MALTDSKLKSINGKPHAKSVIKIADRDGLYVYHRSKGTLAFVYRYRIHGKQKDVVLGKFL